MKKKNFVLHTLYWVILLREQNLLTANPSESINIGYLFIVSILYYRGLVPLHNACSYGHYEVTELLIKVSLDNPRNNFIYFISVT